MRILIHDYSGHPFQVQLSRALAARGHAVRHVYCASFQTPHGNLVRQPGDPEGFAIHPVALDEPFLKQTFLRRRRQEIAIGRLVAKQITEFAPDIVLSSNAPLDTQRLILKETRRQGAKFVFWLQDVYSEAIRRILPKRLPGIGVLVGLFYQAMEYRLLKGSDRIVPIADAFVPILVRHGVAPDSITVIENWAPLDEIVPQPRDNTWALAHMPHPGLRVIYSGTLGYKHNPQLLIDLARKLDGHVHVFSEGPAADGLSRMAAERGIENLHVAGWVPFKNLSAMLSGADVFVAMIDKDAGVYSVPSKVLTYLCIGRPVIGLIPKGNPARDIIVAQKAGIVADPGDLAGLMPEVQALLADPDMRAELGRNGRAYAEKVFDIEPIAARFERVIAAART